ncbi:hypothetical protein [Marinobacter halophilus]|uniref:Uncharacterized protein n=1 Tax=Marinobacter halophilus TaxID=1323740 RepID=A0A2T1K965_9GAMM|nr:hypothetical protein [Marinobacter halophilus]PSF06313.1 hypothetical protein C7H08_14425 [Marinobacter halophilus]GGC71521.1 hypothetical protein GCM10011362_20030 [Marinobacter halophilus]
MDYGDSVQKVLLRKIGKAEQDLLQLKLDYCRFVFGLTHRARVTANGQTWLVRSVDVESMTYTEDGDFTKPVVTGIPEGDDASSETVTLGASWQLEPAR